MGAGDGLTVFDDKIYTVDDYMKLDDGNRYELIGGRLIMTPKPRPKHQEISGEIFNQVKNYLQQNPIGKVYYEVDVHIGDEVVAPDVFFVVNERLDIIGELYLSAAPDLTVEILSPSTARDDKRTKSRLYYDNNVKEYWLVDPVHQVIDIFKAGEDCWKHAGAFGTQDVLTTSLLPGLELNVGTIFGA